MKKQPRYSVKSNRNGLFVVLDNESPIKVVNEDGTISMGRFVASFRTRREAVQLSERLILRHVWGI